MVRIVAKRCQKEVALGDRGKTSRLSWCSIVGDLSFAVKDAVAALLRKV